MADRISYCVLATLPDEATAAAYLAWLEDGHVDAVVRGGAKSAMIVRLDPAPGDPPGVVRVETRYVFATRERFAEYERDHAPALRQDGIDRFGGVEGMTFERRVGEIV